MTDPKPAMTGETRKRKTEAWIGADGDFLGVSNAYSLDEMAQAIVADDHTAWYLAEHYDVGMGTVESVLAWLDEVDVRSVKIPARNFHDERWLNEFPCAMDANPGRGYVKVLGVSLG